MNIQLNFMKVFMLLIALDLVIMTTACATSLVEDVKYVALGKLRWGEFQNIELLGDKEGMVNGFIKFVTIESSLRAISLDDKTGEKIKEERQAMTLPLYCMIGFNSEKKEVALMAFSPGSLIGISSVHVVTNGIYQVQGEGTTVGSMGAYKKLLEAAKFLEKEKAAP